MSEEITFGQKLRQARVKRKMLTNDLADKLGVFASYLSAIQRPNGKIPKFDLLCKIAHVFNEPVEEWLYAAYQQETLRLFNKYKAVLISINQERPDSKEIKHRLQRKQSEFTTEADS